MVHHHVTALDVRKKIVENVQLVWICSKIVARAKSNCGVYKGDVKPSLKQCQYITLLKKLNHFFHPCGSMTRYTEEQCS